MFTASFLNELNDGERKFEKFNTFNEALDFLRTEANEREAWYCQITDDITGKPRCISNLYLKNLEDVKKSSHFIIEVIKMKQTKQARTLVLFNTGTRIHKPKKGKGSYNRKSTNTFEK
jgi:hypothetical protein